MCVHSCLDSLGFSLQTTRSSANADAFVSFFVMCMPFSEFSCRIAAAGTSSPVWSQGSVEADILLCSCSWGNTFSPLLCLYP